MTQLVDSKRHYTWVLHLNDYDRIVWQYEGGVWATDGMFHMKG